MCSHLNIPWSLLGSCRKTVCNKINIKRKKNLNPGFLKLLFQNTYKKNIQILYIYTDGSKSG